MIKKGLLAAAAVALVAAGVVFAAQRGASAPQTVAIYKTPTCGCCALWVKHLEDAGFKTTVTNMTDLSAIKAEHGVPARAQSCHTGIVDGYVIEGHVPASDVKRLLDERPAVAGLAVPGMPVGSPGMEYGDMVEAYDVLSFDDQGQVKVYASYGR